MFVETFASVCAWGNGLESSGARKPEDCFMSPSPSRSRSALQWPISCAEQRHAASPGSKIGRLCPRPTFKQLLLTMQFYAENRLTRLNPHDIKTGGGKVRIGIGVRTPNRIESVKCMQRWSDRQVPRPPSGRTGLDRSIPSSSDDSGEEGAPGGAGARGWSPTFSDLGRGGVCHK